VKVLAIGDVVGDIGLKALLAELPALRERFSPDMVIVNAENASGGVGTSANQAKRLLDAGADVLTGGNHTLHDRSLYPVLDADPRVLRPANIAKRAPGRGVAVVDVAGGQRVAVINLMGLVFINQTTVSPFEVVDDLVDRARRETDLVIVDIHAEATSEKLALAHHVDGRATLVFGTHTHVQTADARILAGGTAYVTDLGMTGPHDSVIGVKTEIIVKRFLTGLSGRFETATEGVLVQGAFVESGAGGHATSIQTFSVMPTPRADPPGWESSDR
jgi:2',3'-cyclic-nucleotide 2'-phosphodiesterase